MAAGLLLVSCAEQSLTGDTYSRDQARRGQTVQMGEIVALKNVKIEGDAQSGKVLGGIAGGFLGSNIGSGRAARTAGAIGGAAAGSVIGSHASQGLGSRQGVEITVRLDSGKTIAVVQEVNPREPFAVGQRVRVLSDGRTTRVAY